jgi:Ca-activated chloride channel family protein
MVLRVLVSTLFMIVFISATAHLSIAAKRDKTLSPYFFIENGEEGQDRLPLKSTQVEVKINALIAQVKVIQQYANEGTRPLHARYVFPASVRAAVHGMRMQVGEQVVVARIQERQEAKQTFETAKKQGKSASLLTEERANVFSMQVANILPGDTIRIELDYTELLVPSDGIYEFVYPTVVGPRYSTLPEAGAAEHHRWIENPYLNKATPLVTAFDISVQIAAGLNITDISCPSHLTDITWQDGSRAAVKLAPAETNGGNRDYVLRFRLSGEEIQTGLMLFKGEKENFFLMMLQPPERVTPRAIVPREYIFVVDVSGSMNGFPLETAKVLLRDLIGSLRPVDAFNVILFAGSAQVLAPHSLPADDAHLAQAIALIDRQQGGGGTELRQALETALQLPRGKGMARNLVVVTDGYIDVEKDIYALIDQHLNDTNFFAFGIGSSVNRLLIEGLARVGRGEPFVVTLPEEAPAVAERFRTYIEAPVLSGIRIQYEDWDVYDLEPQQVPDLFAQRPLVVCGKWRGQAAGRIHLSGTSGGGAFTQSLNLAHLAALESNSALPYLWARTRLARLTDFRPANEDQANRDEVIALGLTYHLLTPHTAFVAVDETVRNLKSEGDEVDHPLPLPKGVSNLAVGGGHTVPEPGLVFMIALLCLGVLASWMRRRSNR